MNLSFQIGPLNVRLGKQPKEQVRGYDSARINRLNADWLMPQTSADAEIASGIVALRGRARELERNNEYIQAYLGLLENNVLGAGGVALETKVVDPSGESDKLANAAIKKAWVEWCKRDSCTMSGSLCFREVEGLSVRRTACDGGILIREFIGAPNAFGYSLDVLEMDQLDIDYNEASLPGGGDIRMGIERDQWRKPVAFYLFVSHPGENVMRQAGKRIRIPASEIIHLFWQERPSQTIGVPWIASVMQSIETLGKYREAELVAAREGACKGYAIEQETPVGYSGPKDTNGNPTQETSPGMGLLLSPGQKYISIDPTHPNSAFGDFNKATLRGIAAGLRVNYNSLANDLESVNYSSMRAGKLEEMEEYMNVQNWLVESLHERVFKRWLSLALVQGAIKMPNGSALPVSKFEKFNAADWKPRRWPWVDPKKDLEAAILAVNNGFKSRRSVIAEMSQTDIETVFAEQKQDNDLADENDLEFPADNPAKEVPDLTPPQE